MRFLYPALTSLILIAKYGAASPISSLLEVFQDVTSLSKRGDGCGDEAVGPFFIGSGAGTPFCDYALGNGGGIIKDIEVWSDDQGIRGMFFTFTDGHTTKHGVTGKGNTDKIEITAGETVQLATTRGNGKGEHVGRIYLKTDKQEFTAGPDVGAKDNNIDVGSGLLMAAAGTDDGGDYLKSLAWIFLKPKIDKVNVNNIEYDEDPTGSTKGITTDMISDSTFGNPEGSTGDVKFEFSASKEVTKTTTWDQTTKGTFGMEYGLEFEAGIPLIEKAKVSVKASWSVEHSTSNGGSESNKVTVGSKLSTDPIPPGKGKYCRIVTQHGEGNFPYTSHVQLKLEGGGELVYSERGVQKSVQYSNAYGWCEDSDNPADWSGDPDHLTPGLKVIEKPDKVGVNTLRKVDIPPAQEGTIQ